MEIEFGDTRFPMICGVAPWRELLHLVAQVDPDRILLVTDEVVGPLHAARFEQMLGTYCPVHRLTIGVGERVKAFATLAALCEQAIHAGATRRSLVAALGGGIVGNVAGLMASLLFRGVVLLQLPTTLLAASDSVISLKTAINSDVAKNAFGTYLAPCGAVVDVTTFETLPQREVRSALCELLKNALAIEPGTIDELISVARDQSLGRLRPPWMRLVEMGVDAKSRVMRDDPHEKAAGVVLEYGHTLGHAIELIDSAHGINAISHGEAIAVGMRLAAAIAERLRVGRPGLLAAHDEILLAAGLSRLLPAGINWKELLNLVMRDNKRGRIAVGPDEIGMVLLKDFGRPARTGRIPLVPVPLAIIGEVLREFASDSERDGVISYRSAPGVGA